MPLIMPAPSKLSLPANPKLTRSLPASLPSVPSISTAVPTRSPGPMWALWAATWSVSGKSATPLSTKVSTPPEGWRLFASTGTAGGARAGSGPEDRARFQEFTMTEKPKKLSNTAHALLTAAALRDDHLIQPPQLPAAAARQVVRSLLNAGLAEEVPAVIDDVSYVWRQGDDGSDLMLWATTFGLARIREAEGSAPAPY